MSGQSKEVSKILKRFKQARDKRKESRDDVWMELDAFDRGDQWKIKGDVADWTPRPVTNFVHLVKYTKRAALAVENPTGKLRSTSPNDKSRIESLQRVYEFEWRKLGLRKNVREAVEISKLLGTGITQLSWDENFVGGGTGFKYEGRILSRTIDTATFFPDPAAFSIEDCRFIHIAERKTYDWLKSVPQFRDKIDQVKASLADHESRGEIYHRDYQTGDQKNDVVDFHSHYEKVPNKDGGYTYKVTYLANDVKLHVIDDLRPKRYPFSILYDFKQMQDFWGKSTCEFILDNQKLINKIESILATIGLLLQNPQKIVSKESGINPKEVAKYGNASGHTFVANGDPRMAIFYATPPQIPQALFNLLENAKANIREVTGMSESYMGHSVGSLQTSSGVEQLIDRSTLRDRDQMYDVEMYIEDLSRLLIGFIAEYYTDERVMRIDNPHAETEEQRETFESFIGTDFAELEYDMEIDVSAKAPISRMRQQQEAEKLLNMQGQYQYEPAVITPKEYIRMSEFVDADKLIKRMDMEELKNKVEEASQVAQMIVEGKEQGIPDEDLMEMAGQMFENFDNPEATGTGTTGSFQQRQQGV